MFGNASFKFKFAFDKVGHVSKFCVRKAESWFKTLAHHQPLT